MLWAHNRRCNIYIYMGLSVYWLLSVLCVCVCVCVYVCVISNQSISKKLHYVIWKSDGGRQYRWGLHKTGGRGRGVGVAPLCQLCKETLKISHPPHYKTTSPFLAPPISRKNFPSSYYSHFWKISSPTLWKGVGGRGFGLCLF